MGPDRGRGAAAQERVALLDVQGQLGGRVVRAVPDMRRQRRRLGLLRRGCRHQHMHVQCGIFGHWRCLRGCLQPSISTLFIDLVFLCLLVPGGGVR